MKNIKKLTAILLVAVMAVACFAVSAGAADTAVTVTVGDVTVTYAEDALAKLADGNKASDATEFSNEGLVSFKNEGFNHEDGVDAAVEATFEIVVDLGETKAITGVSLDCFKDTLSMVDLPTGVKFYASADGKCYYDVNAGNTVAPAADAAEKAMATLTADFSTRMAVNARYIKAVVTYKNGWVFASELSVTEASDASLAVDLEKAYDATIGATPSPGIGVFDSTFTGGNAEGKAGEIDCSLNNPGVNFLNSQLIKAVYDETTEAYKIVYSKVNPWPDGHSGTETLAEGEILLAIVTGGGVKDDAFSAPKWIARGLTEGDYVILNKTTAEDGTETATVTFVPAAHFADDGNDESGDVTEDVSSEDASSEAVSSEAASSEDASSAPQAGDTGVIVFAVLGLLAVVGVAVAVKARH